MTEDTLTLTSEEVLQCVNGGMTMYTHIDRAVKPEPKERLTLKCSECRAEYYDDIKEHCGDDVPEYCPNCGAHMTKGEND